MNMLAARVWFAGGRRRAQAEVHAVRLHACCAIHPLLPSAPGRRLQEFYTDLKDAEREGEVQRILGAFKLNPYEQLGMRNEAPVEEVRRQYRKVRRRPGERQGARCAGQGAGPGGGDGSWRLLVAGVVAAGMAARHGSPHCLPRIAAGLPDGAPRQVQARARQGRL